jgi:hypothetical protein
MGFYLFFAFGKAVACVLRGKSHFQSVNSIYICHHWRAKIFCAPNRPRGLGLLRLPIFAAQDKKTLRVFTFVSGDECRHSSEQGT